MEKIVKITIEQRTSLIGVEVMTDTYFNLEVLDINNNYVIGELEVLQCSIQWLKELPLETYERKPDII